MSAAPALARETPVPVAGARVGVLGLARSGAAVARLLAQSGAEVYASDVSSAEGIAAAARALAAEGVDAVAGGHDRARLAACDWLVVSPGIPPAAPVLEDPVITELGVYSEIEVASWFARAPIVAVTGTNGKSTTTALLGALALEAGLRASVAGNIGRAFSAAILEDPDADWYIVEVSSFQLAGVATFRPRVAVVLNFSADHLDRYSAIEDYLRDKARIAAQQGAEDHLCLSAEDPALFRLGLDRPVARHWFHRSRPVERGATVLDGWITLVEEPGAGRVVQVDRLKIPGWHNVQNALAATLAAALMGIDRAGAATGLAAFTGIPHRLETVAVRDGVTWVNDSKATNVASAEVGLQAFQGPLIVILGGRHKGSPYAPLAPLLTGRAHHVLAIGEAASRIESELGAAAPVTVVGTLERAVERARELARPGDVVLLSPACSSYDQFTGFEERGECFRRLAQNRAAGPKVRR
ncbi:MAG TPA: UDP-N-acetylmuramoyl-L-alanine--D-glutamate ligase [Gemmatimonadota bacterium]|nr:UDP-N-acetylmuramoyl-L-alanine--D-glutamate ligase [Gemmatimonadota bacterium]